MFSAGIRFVVLDIHGANLRSGAKSWHPNFHFTMEFTYWKTPGRNKQELPRFRNRCPDTMQCIWNTVAPAARPAKTLQSHSPYRSECFEGNNYKYPAAECSRLNRTLFKSDLSFPVTPKHECSGKEVAEYSEITDMQKVWKYSWVLGTCWLVEFHFDPDIFQISVFFNYPSFASGWMMEPSWTDWLHWSERSHPHRKTSLHEIVPMFKTFETYGWQHMDVISVTLCRRSLQPSCCCR